MDGLMNEFSLIFESVVGGFVLGVGGKGGGKEGILSRLGSLSLLALWPELSGHGHGGCRGGGCRGCGTGMF